MLTRRVLLAALAATAAIPRAAWAQQTRVRLSWNAFKASAQFQPFVNAIRTMRANTDSTDPKGWHFWADVHENFCPHGLPYFLAWHRAYLGLFERKLQEVSGVANLTVPYWDYYTSPTIPPEFTQGSPQTNPLFHPRLNTDVRDALSLDPFASQVVNLKRGDTNAFEPALEGRPHNRVHSLIGMDMVQMQSPRDPIFWLHHANIDRLWVAWVAAGAGRTMPARASAYWLGNFDFASGLTAPRGSTYDTASTYGYRYDNQAMPQVLPGQTPPRPPIRSVTSALAGGTRPNFFSVGSGAPLALGAEDFSVRVPIAPAIRGRMAPLLSDAPSVGPNSIQSLSVVLDGVALTDAGARGGYFYKVYLNLPTAGGAPEVRHLIGEVTPFEIAAAARHDHGAADRSLRLVLPATEVLRGLPPQDVSQLTISFVRVAGQASPTGTAIEVRNFKVEASTAPVE